MSRRVHARLLTLLIALSGSTLPLNAATPTYRHVAPDGAVTFSDAPMRDGKIVRTSYRTDFFQKGSGVACTGHTESTLDQRAKRWLPAMQAAADRYRLDPLLLLAVARVESCFDERARSKAGAEGLMQLMPATAEELGVADSWHGASNLDGGARYLRRMLTRYGDNLEWALAAYNAGPGNVDRYQGIPPFPETQRYIVKVRESRQRYALAGLLSDPGSN